MSTSSPKRTDGFGPPLPALPFPPVPVPPVPVPVPPVPVPPPPPVLPPPPDDEPPLDFPLLPHDGRKKTSPAVITNARMIGLSFMLSPSFWPCYYIVFPGLPFRRFAL
ncbi:MAG: hypothetical protein E3J72_22295 [Planctomycetota bacterium]|nr:MAG: hypothetical protein E3J72_22295 [Planctomycetota bacterium]